MFIIVKEVMLSDVTAPKKFWNIEILILEFPGGLAIKDLVLSLLWLWFDPWLRNFHIPQACQKKKKKKKKNPPPSPPKKKKKKKKMKKSGGKEKKK